MPLYSFASLKTPASRRTRRTTSQSTKRHLTASSAALFNTSDRMLSIVGTVTAVLEPEGSLLAPIDVPVLIPGPVSAASDSDDVVSIRIARPLTDGAVGTEVALIGTVLPLAVLRVAADASVAGVSLEETFRDPSVTVAAVTRTGWLGLSGTEDRLALLRLEAGLSLVRA